MKGIWQWIKAHLVIILSIISIVAVGGLITTSIIIINMKNDEEIENKDQKDEVKSKDNNKNQKEKTKTMICRTEYEDGEEVTFEFIYDSKAEKLQKSIIKHKELGLTTADEKQCKQLDKFSGVSCSFDKMSEPYKYTMEFTIAKLDSESREILEDMDYNFLFSLSMSETKKVVQNNFDGMTCSIKNENNTE